MSVKYTVKASITTSTKTTVTHGFNAKITLGKEVAKYAGNAGGELGYTFSKATENMEQLAQEATSEASADVGPGKSFFLKIICLICLICLIYLICQARGGF